MKQRMRHMCSLTTACEHPTGDIHNEYNHDTTIITDGHLPLPHSKRTRSDVVNSIVKSSHHSASTYMPHLRNTSVSRLEHLRMNIGTSCLLTISEHYRCHWNMTAFRLLIIEVTDGLKMDLKRLDVKKGANCECWFFFLFWGGGFENVIVKDLLFCFL